MRLFRLAYIFSALFACTEVHAEIYKSTDSHGNVTYTDRPAKDAKPVDVRSTNSIPAVQTPEPAQDQQQASSKTDETVRYRYVRIIDPADDSGIEHGPGNFTVLANTRPGLAENHALQLYLDGAAYGKANTSGSFTLTNINRGTHELMVSVVDANGKPLKNSETIKVHVFRPSVLQPGLNRR